MKQRLVVVVGGEPREVTVERDGATYRVAVGDEALVVNAHEIGPGQLHLLCEGQGYDVLVERRGDQVLVHRRGTSVSLTLQDERQRARRAAMGSGGQRDTSGVSAIRAPMPGKVVKLLARLGEQVSAGQGIVVIEAMKMENELRTTIDGTVKEIRVVEGANVEAGENLALIG